MSTDYLSRIDDLVDQAWALEDGPAKLALYEEAVRLADAHQDVEQGFDLRDDVVRVGTFAGYAEKAIVAFSWRLAQCDRDPDRYPESRLMWQYKWIVSSLSTFPEISLKQIHEMLEDMEARYRRVGLNLRPVWKERCRLARSTDRKEDAREYYKRWKNTPRDYGSDCAACDRDFRMDHLLYLGRRKQALEVGQPILDGDQRCASIPHGTFATVLIPLLKLDRREEAKHYHKLGYPMISTNRNYLWEAGEHMRFKALMGDRAGAVRLFERHLPWALETREASPQFHFYLCSLFVMRELIEHGRTSMKMHLPESYALHNETGKYEIADLEVWFEKECALLAARFDARNGNTMFSERIEKLGKLKRYREVPED